MNRTIVVLATGIVAAIVAHVGWFEWNRPCAGDQLDCQLAWIKTELKLTDAQYARVRMAHEISAPRLIALATQAAKLRQEYADFERERMTAGQIDFVDFARFVEQRRAIDRECLAATGELVAATTRAMSADQRERYFGLLTPAAAPAEPATE